MSTAEPRNTPASSSTVRQSAGSDRSMSSPPSASPRPPRSTSTARRAATTSRAVPTTKGTVFGPTGPRWVMSTSMVNASVRTSTPRASRRTQTPSSEWSRSQERAGVVVRGAVVPGGVVRGAVVSGGVPSGVLSGVSSRVLGVVTVPAPSARRPRARPRRPGTSRTPRRSGTRRPSRCASSTPATPSSRAAPPAGVRACRARPR